MSNHGDWETIVPALPAAEAEKRFSEWKLERERKGLTIPPEDVRRDQILAGPGEGCLVRYLVRKGPERSAP
jgi:hypothetical protein